MITYRNRYKDILYILKYYNLEKYIYYTDNYLINIRIGLYYPSVVITEPCYYDYYNKPKCLLHRLYKAFNIIDE